MATNNNSDSECSAVQLLQEINSGVLDAKTLDKPSRQRCIELLIAEGYGYQHISQVLKISEKTVSRDMKEIRTRNELTPSIEFAKETIGDLFRQGLNHHAYLMRLARSKDATNSEKIQAEFASWRVLRELVERMQSLGYLPMKPAEIVGNFFHHSDAEKEPSIDDMKAMVMRIEEAAKEAEILDEEAIRRIQALRKKIEQLELAGDIKKLEDNTNKKENDNE